MSTIKDEISFQKIQRTDKKKHKNRPKTLQKKLKISCTAERVKEMHNANKLSMSQGGKNPTNEERNKKISLFQQF